MFHIVFRCTAYRLSVVGAAVRVLIMLARDDVHAMTDWRLRSEASRRRRQRRAVELARLQREASFHRRRQDD